ncbi:hypothetical protein A3H10_03840 [Candidatus Uhrbacteria bacterium RIFCSPLOWO2_12_FULL_46_10]|uniref:Uncharacterized protein n=1 Tax=Candidatus Uhrbacteria bacterium RIFCSPLOWO2_01_FULL_47_25 TaxID=1802402 RepID=A0A1F7URS3_9BACT|nr:MAG: hypothetical protein UX68_C0005G0012 [Parcubacteria group bacterium GW2011_GWA2_46_9]OGL60619.1 MAG: hypothetical protein A2752_02215 [Candidatus Uhrbacteria bacterium RIFCSPHIGHO2_01_FULL_46_23]OGL68142.1 MAG: hypothetical protein A3D60_04020 [Candidatus Uhrbacteria bacterium RIFCSPHIGHO2_02_FULL_47_29]OGL74813.1 MAG: hypothetical protein A3E96_04665 [Candidatus Uhrbacteria bacterium RIFCSPHIGHO2_12_FULL_46_13]OGL80993.1 MAG: hypothetical protein A2936_03355 [Candidatus Uhrbacteria bac
MTDDRWQKLIESLEDDKRLESRATEDLDGRPGTVERIIAKTPAGRVRLSRTTEPKRLAEKAFYSKRGGSTVAVQKIYDETEKIHVFSIEIFSPVSNNWTRVEANQFSLPH